LLNDKAARSPAVSWRRVWPWLNLALTAVLIVAGLWYLSRRVSLAAVAAALAAALPGYVLLAIIIMLATIALKSWRWQLMLNHQPKAESDTPAVPFSAAFWATCLGQYVNLIVPFLRVGEVARLYALNREAGVGPARALGTLVVEKTLDLIFFGLTAVALLPFVVLPASVGRPGPALVLLPLALLAVLYLLAYRTAFVIGVWRAVVRPLPDRPREWLLRIAVSGLEGLAALRDRRLNLVLLLQSLVVALLAVALPWVLFPALGLSLTWLDAALMHVVVSVITTPPSTPGKIGVFNGAAALMLVQSGVTNEALIAGYAILFYLVVIVPQIVLGVIAAARTKWHWSAAPAT
jgi:uncharacterized protein (TIRG00374 family)